MSAWEVSSILFPVFIGLVFLRVPVAFSLGLACIPVFLIEDRLTPFLLMNEMYKSYNSFVLLAVPFFLLAANLMNAAGITDRGRIDDTTVELWDHIFAINARAPFLLMQAAIAVMRREGRGGVAAPR